SRMEYILNNTILALLDFPGTTLLGINRLLADEEYRRRVVNNTQDPVVKAFWQTEFASYNDKYKQEAVAPIQNKIGQFLSASVIRNIVAQVKSRINIREIMDEKKIFIMNLSKGRIGEDNSRLLGGMLITKIQLSAMERVDTPEAERKDFFLYVDEFQNFATESFANILSEARKYRLDLTMAHQYMEQLEEEVLAAVIGNVGTIVTFRVGSSDAEILAKEFIPTFVEEDLINLPKFHIYLKLMIDGVASRPFSALTMAPIAQATGSMEKVVRVSRERYAVNREKIEDKIARWSGMVIIPGDEAAQLEVDDEDAMFAEFPKDKKPDSIPPAKTPPPAAAKPTPPPSAPAPKPAEPKPAPMPTSAPTAPTPAPVAEPMPNIVVIENNINVLPAAPAPTAPANPAPKVVPTVNHTSAVVRPVMNSQPSSGSQMQSRPAGQPGQPGQPGSGKRKRKRKKGGQGGQGFGNPQNGSPVAIVDTQQKGISLSALQSNAPRQNPPAPQNPPQPIEKPQSVSAPALISVEENKKPDSIAPAVEEKPVRVYAMPEINTVEPKKPVDHTPKTLKSGQVDKIDE
ncbi:MAG: type IV secretory system conjugative DNA transfer family protein, partial [Candidatus Magasanikbacteria bacterium]|nr:type IV secretory system conjugative DNA transfer family protein [Candidatus Magasanikbacteria bacterium]